MAARRFGSGFGSIAALGLVLFSGAACGPSSGAKFAPASGVLTVSGTTAGDVIVVRVAAGGAIVVNNGQMPITGGVPTVANTTRIELRGREGADFLELDEAGGPLPGGLLVGGPGADVLVGGSGDDEAEGGEGEDVALLGGGDDTFVWRTGGGNDTVEGEEGFDRLRFHGEDAAETVDVSPDAGRVRFSQNAGAAVIASLGGVEAIEYLARGGADAVAVNDMTGTELTRVDVDLAGTNGGGDGAADSISVVGTQGADAIGITGEAGGIHLFGLQTSVHVVHQEPAADALTVHALAGADRVDASGPGAGAIRLTVNGGLGVDEILGSDGDDQITGGDGDDLVAMGGGDDTFTWNPGDDLDTIDGEDGFDSLLVNGANIGENVDISANAGRVRFFRNVASVSLDLGTVEAIDFVARGGSDYVVVNDLSGTDLVEVGVDLAAAGGGGDGLPDGITVIGTGGNDTVQIAGNASEVSLIGLAAQVHLANPESANDALAVYTLAGDDLVHAAGLQWPSIYLTADGGGDDDVLIGGDGVDVLYGGEGDDVLQGGPGVDVLDGGPGSNIVIQ